MKGLKLIVLVFALYYMILSHTSLADEGGEGTCINSFLHRLFCNMNKMLKYIMNYIDFSTVIIKYSKTYDD